MSELVIDAKAVGLREDVARLHVLKPIQLQPSRITYANSNLLDVRNIIRSDDGHVRVHEGRDE